VNHVSRLLLATAVAALLIGCNDRTDRTDSGGVLLEVEVAGNGIPFRVPVNGIDSLMVPTITINSIVAEPGAVTSQIMDVEMERLEVRFERGDAGTRVPPPYVVDVLGTIPVGGTLTLNNWDVMSFEQFRSPPLSDLKFENGGIDQETGLEVIRLNLIIRAFGRTRSGTNVSSVPRGQTIEFTQ